MAKNIHSLLFSEFLGTFILVLGCNISVISEDDKGTQKCSSLIILLCIFIAITIGLRISADYNPGVSYMMFISEKDKKEKEFKSRLLSSFIITQCAASVVAHLTSYNLNNGIVFNLKINKSISPANAFVVEIFCTAVLYYVILFVSDTRNDVSHDPTMKVLVILAGIGTGMALGGNISMAGMNPAVGFGSNFTRFLLSGDINEVKYLWIYIFAPFISAHIVDYLYNKINK